MLSNIKLSESTTVMALAASVNSYKPLTSGRCTEQKLYTENDVTLVKSFAYDRGGAFVRGILINYDFFLINSINRLGWLMNCILAPFAIKRKARICNKYLLILWTDQLTEIEAIYHDRKGSLALFSTKREAIDQFSRLSRLLKWIKTEKTYLLKNVTYKEVGPIFSEYVMSVGIPFATLQSNFHQIARK